jgi:hypothetical protein
MERKQTIVTCYCYSDDRSRVGRKRRRRKFGRCGELVAGAIFIAEKYNISIL